MALNKALFSSDKEDWATPHRSRQWWLFSERKKAWTR